MMTKEEVFEGLKEVLAVIRPKTNMDLVNYDTELVRELGIDSLSMMLLALASEEKFQMKFPEGKPLPVTVGEVCDTILQERKG